MHTALGQHWDSAYSTTRLLGRRRDIPLTTVLSLTTCHCGGDELTYLLKAVFKQASLPLSHSHHPSGARVQSLIVSSLLIG